MAYQSILQVSSSSLPTSVPSAYLIENKGHCPAAREAGRAGQCAELATSVQSICTRVNPARNRSRRGLLHRPAPSHDS